MNTANILFIIARHLTFRDLLSFGQVNKLFNSVSKKDELWKRECLRVYFGNYDIFGSIYKGDEYLYKPTREPHWRHLLKKLIQTRHSWLLLKGDSFTHDDLDTLRCEVFLTLQEPLLPPPPLRREPKTFPTIIQDLLAHIFEEPSQIGFNLPTESEMIIEGVMNQNLIDEIGDNVSIDQIAIIKWALKGNKCDINKSLSLGSSGNQSTCYSSTGDFDSTLLTTYFQNKMINANPLIIKLFCTLKKTIKIHCVASWNCLNLIEEATELLSEYCLRWDAFCASIYWLDKIFLPFSILINQSYDIHWPNAPKMPPFTVMRLMMIIWRRHVFNKLKDYLLDSIFNLLQSQRNMIVKECPTFKGEINRIIKEDTANIMIKAIQAVVDLSVNELNIYFIDHSGFKGDGEYQLLHEKVLKLTQQFYEEVSSYPYAAQIYILGEDLKLAQRAFLPCTWTKIERMGVEIKIESMKNLYYSEYKQFIPISLTPEEEGLDRFVYSPFGKMLFSNDQSHAASRNIKLYIDYLRIRNRLQEVMDYNNLDALCQKLKQPKLVEDEEIEYQNEQMGLKLEVPPEEQVLFSISNDIHPGQFLAIISAFKTFEG
ncbi:unnamed protein product [Blepharisma stoltei]|uniref:F-box domain-containing protein n=1 Tax=Blepharisma stoltei TaxID=1481888 RepID=A0AAU9JCD6_9CILI|nr:unnamed protein product [Blepharisma stoltei]